LGNVQTLENQASELPRFEINVGPMQLINGKAESTGTSPLVQLKVSKNVFVAHKIKAL